MQDRDANMRSTLWAGKNKRGSIAPATLLTAVLLVMGPCGGDEGQSTFYSVDVVNNTDAAITVRYDWNFLFITYSWLNNTTIPPSGHEIIEWSSEKPSGEQIDVEYRGKWKLYTVSPFQTLAVSIQHFPN